MAEPQERFIDPGAHLTPDERDPEAPTADAVEQAIPADPAEQPAEFSRGLEVGEWDAVEQSRVVELDDDYR
ncbi:MAG TPA: hypothetical protein VJT31_04605 [Rugosimonospora sp.]|nr:hypothetical protein [Rugosimonospora sp.]